MKLRKSITAVVALAATATTVYGGIAGTGFTRGAIGRLSSVVVNGVTYDTATAEITINGQPAAETDLLPGQTADIEGTVFADGISGVATRVSVSAAVHAPLDAVDTTAGELFIAGQQIETTLTTLFDRQGGLAAFAPGEAVRVFGLFDDEGDLVPTLIGAGDPLAPIAVSGDVDAVTAPAMLTINGLDVDTSGAAAGAAVAVGDRVRVEGLAFGALGELLATTVVRIDTALSGAPGSTASLSGVVDTLASPSAFTVDGQPIAVGGDTVLVGAPPALGSSVLVEGLLNAAGVVDAVTVRTLADVDTVLGGIVEETEDDEIEFTNGVSVDIDDLTAFQDLSTAAVRLFGLEHIRAGDRLDVRAVREDDDDDDDFDAVAVIRLETGAAPVGDDDDDDDTADD